VGLLPIHKVFGKRPTLILSIAILVISGVLIYPILFTDYYYTAKNLNILAKAMALASVGLLLGQLINLSDKKSLLVGISLIVLAVAGVFMFTRYIGSLLNQKLDTINQWTIENYQISCYREIGIAGPAIIKYTLFETKLKGYLTREISSTVENRDSVCLIIFEGSHIGENYHFDKCNGTIFKTKATAHNIAFVLLGLKNIAHQHL